MHAPSVLNLTVRRAYSANFGRFLNRDPMEENAGSNLYAYVQNAPLELVDPSGLMPAAVATVVIDGVAYTLVGDAAGGAIVSLGATGAEVGVLGAGATAVIGGALSLTGIGLAALGALTTSLAILRQQQHDAYKARCGASVPSNKTKLCDILKWKLERDQDCLNMKKAWDAQWLPGRHANDISNLQRGIYNREKKIKKCCP
jgi:type VI secretion system secreted protein VgrG